MTAGNRLRDFDNFSSSLRNFQWLGKAASGATDIDCLIERRGRFLVLEGKRWHNGGLHVPLGQHIMLTQLCALDAFTVYLVGEVPPAEPGADCELFYLMRYGLPHPSSTTSRGAYFPSGLFFEATRDDLRSLVHDWFDG